MSFCVPFDWDGFGAVYAAENESKIKKINGQPCASDEIIIIFKDNASKENKANTLDAIDPEYKSLPVKNTVKVKIPKDKTLEEYLVELNQNPDIEFAQPNYLYELDATVTDPFASPASGNYQWFHDTINTFEAWDYTMGSGATVAVLDTGAYISHEDLGANITLMPDYVLDDTDGDWVGDTPDGYDDDHGHGTHVTGIIAATGNNGLGGLGVAPQSNVLAYDVFENYYYIPDNAWYFGAFTDDIVFCIEQAVTDGADVINMSLGSYQEPGSDDPWDVAFETAVDDAVSNGVVVVCSAGNDGWSDGDPDYEYHRPSDYDTAISVINTDVNDNKAATSNYGPLKDISAPGESIVSTMNNGSYASWGGTSMASPMVAGVCALILSANPSLSVNQVKNILYTTADDLGAEGKDDIFAWGRVNAQAAVLMAKNFVYKIELDKETMDVEMGTTGSLSETMSPASASDVNVSWSSSDDGIASVASDGTVTGISPGTVTITATNTGDSFIFTDTCEVTVNPESDYYTYEPSTGTITGYTGSLSELTIPSNIDGTDITAIGNEAFFDMASLTSVAISNGITSIGNTAFAQCVNLTTVSIPESLNDIGSFAFVACDSLEEINVSPANTTFSSASGILFNKAQITLLLYPAGKADTSYVIPGTVETIGNSAFYNSSNLTGITIPNSVTSIEASAFQGCTGLTSVDLPDSLTSIEGHTFSGCTQLSEILIPSTVQSIGEQAFVGCTSLSDIMLPDGITTLGVGVFQNCSILTAATIPASVTSIGDYAFDGCHASFAIHGTPLSYAETYAINNSIPFVDITGSIRVTGVELDITSKSLPIGTSFTLNETVLPTDATIKTVTWESDDIGIATVSDGEVTGVSLGTATITVTTDDGGFSDTCDVTVIPVPVTGVTLNKSSSSLYVGASEILKATVSPGNAANKAISWSSDTPGVATVDSSGMVTAVSAGSATITVTTDDGGHTDTCTVNVSSISEISVDETIRVKLSINDPTYLYFFTDGNFSVAGGSGEALERQQYHIDIEGSELVLKLGTQEKARGTTITLVQHEASANRNNFIWIDNYEHGPTGYWGKIVFSISGGVIQAVNHIYLEEYLYGVLPYEMSDSWPAEALKAQAVAARSYAVASMGGGDYDVVDTSSSQVYEGYDSSKTNSISAVDATSNNVLQYGNTVKKTYFAASNGGYTDSPLHVWPSGDNMPYAIYEDPYDVANGSSPFEQIFFPVVIDGSHPITTSDNVDGTPSITNAVNYIKSRILASGQLSGYGVTSVNDFDLTGVLELVPHTYDTDDGENHSINLPDGTNDCVDFVMATGHFTVSVGIDSYEVTGIELDLRYFDASNGVTAYKVFNMSALRLFVIEGDETGWSIYQRRYGHGVGLSQRGAQQRANSGQLYDYILSFYYPYTSLMTLNYGKDPLTANEPLTDSSNASVDCNDYLNVRDGPSTGDNIVGTLPADARIEVTATGTWHTINFGGVNCYVHSDYVNLDGYVAVTDVDIVESSITIDKGASQTLSVTIAPSNATNKNVTWSSDDESVATVNSSGDVLGVGGGNATITVTTQDGSHTDTCTVNVQVDVTGVALDKSSIVVYMGKTKTLTATVAPADATDKSVSWSSDDEGIATVSEGVVTPVSEGSAVITVTTTDGEFTDTCNVTVAAAPTDAIYSSVYTVDQSESLLLDVPDEITLSAVIANLDNSPGDIVILDASDVEITNLSTFAGTGMTVQLVDGGVVDELDIVVLGDVDGNGLIDIIDYSYVKLHIFNVFTQTGNGFIAGDVDKSDAIDILDYSYVKLDIFDVAHIN